MSSEQQIADMQRRVRRWLETTEPNGKHGTLEGLEADIHALESELKALFPGDRVGEEPLESLKEQAMFRTVLESMIEGVIVVDMEGQPLVFNAAARQMLDQDGTGSDPETWSEQYGLFHADGKTLYRPQDLPLTRSVEGETVPEEELIIRLSEESEDVHISASAHPLWCDNGVQMGGMVVFHDVTRAKKVEKALRDASHQAEEASRAKSEFLANMSHEIRTPLTAVLGFSDLLLDPNLGESDRLSYVQAVMRNGQHLLGLINDVLDLSKLQADKVKVEKVDFSLQQLLHEVVSVMQVRAYEKGLKLNVVYDTPIPVHIRNDSMRIRQILFNLVSNAIKFTREGSVTLSCRCLDPGTVRSRLEIDVTDTGIGMSEEEIEKLFQPFRQANLSTSREYGGTGLGLTICRALSEALGGEIQVDTRPGKGSVFRLVLDQPIDANAEMVAKHYQNLEVDEQGLQRPEFRKSLSGRILLAEDGLDNQLLISTLLKREGLEVDIASDGEQAVDKASQALADGRPYDLILMDMQMPRLDGYGATTKLRRQGYTGPVVALTAHAMVGERERCMTAGCDDYLTKPISPSVLIAGVEAYLHRIRGGDSDLVATGEASPERPRTRGAIHSTYAEDPDMQKLIEGFIERLPKTLKDIQLAHEGGDTERMRRLAHQLKGSAGGYGFLPVSQDAARLEKAVRQAESPDELESAMKRLTDTCERVEPVTKG